MNCPECRTHSTKMGESAAAMLYRCPKGHNFRVPKAPALASDGSRPPYVPPSPYRTAPADDLFTPPDTSRDRSSYAAPKPFGPDSLPAKALAWLREEPHRIDHHEAERRWNHTRLAGTIHILRTHGYKFETHMNEGKVAVYELLNPEHRHPC